MEYLEKFRQGIGSMAMNAIDYYHERGRIIKHSWAMGGESHQTVSSVPAKIEGYEKIPLTDDSNARN